MPLNSSSKGLGLSTGWEEGIRMEDGRDIEEIGKLMVIWALSWLVVSVRLEWHSSLKITTLLFSKKVLYNYAFVDARACVFMPILCCFDNCSFVI